jgi:hypothetical protein
LLLHDSQTSAHFFLSETSRNREEVRIASIVISTYGAKFAARGLEMCMATQHHKCKLASSELISDVLNLLRRKIMRLSADGPSEDLCVSFALSRSYFEERQRPGDKSRALHVQGSNSSCTDRISHAPRRLFLTERVVFHAHVESSTGLKNQALIRNQWVSE